ncbi:MAG: glycosyltransferase family 1 protein [Chloroflexota bacterium]
MTGNAECPTGGYSIGLVARAEAAITGTSRYADGLRDGLAERGIALRIAPIDTRFLPRPVTGLARRAGLDPQRFFTHYPVRMKTPPVDAYHLTTQNLASVLMTQRLRRPTLVTVHDIIPWLVRDDRALCVYTHPLHRLFDWVAMQGLRRATGLLAVSEWTKRTLVQELGIPSKRIQVCYNGLDHELFKPHPVKAEFRERYGLPADRRYLLYVGSEDPRKNLGGLLRAFAAVRAQRPDLVLLKVGAPQEPGRRRQLQTLAGQLGIADAVRWIDRVPDADLPGFYAASELLLMPSFYEGFGYPVLESMACGTPVVCADAASVPELAGDAASLVDPRRPQTWVEPILTMLEDARQRDRARERGLTRASAFTWERASEITAGAYAALLSR